MKISIYYWKAEFMSEYLHGRIPSREDLKNHYVKMPVTMEFKDSRIEDRTGFLVSLYSFFNMPTNLFTSPSIQEFIRKHNLHTSMSVGDIVAFDNDYYIVASIGFEHLHNFGAEHNDH